MSEREQINQLLDIVPDYKMGYVIAYLQGLTEDEEIPNNETIAAFKEIDEMKRTGNFQKFNNLDELWTSLEE